jgi:thiol-disulfide isomerase/thioredoxin
MKTNTRSFLFALTFTIAAVFPLMGSVQASVRLPVEGAFPSLAGATGWLNSPPLTPEGLRGKVVVIDFWTYTCINWLRTMPHVRAWSTKYKERGLVVIGVHSPEFPFEQKVDNVRRAAKELDVPYPIALDSGFAVWRAFSNDYWPALYIIDAQGRIRHHQFGEGGYEESEQVIQQLLDEASGAATPGQKLVRVEGKGIEADADWNDSKSAETYLGGERAEGFASPGGAVADESHVYTAPANLQLNRWALQGDWTVSGRAVSSNQPNGRIVYRFHSRDLHLVMGTPGGAKVRFRVHIDGAPPGAAHGLDVDEAGNGTIAGQRLYQLIRQPKPIVDRQFEIEFLEPGVEAFSFTFG